MFVEVLVGRLNASDAQEVGNRSGMDRAVLSDVKVREVEPEDIDPALEIGDEAGTQSREAIGNQATGNSLNVFGEFG